MLVLIISLIFDVIVNILQYTHIYIHFNIDIDECAADIDGCNHNCSNTNGSYVCFCYTGYKLHDNMKTCIGKVYSYIYCYQFLVYTMCIYMCTANVYI